MEKRIGIEASIAIAEAVGLCDADVVAAYPITPQTHIVEHLSEMVADGHLDAAFVPVESEHSAMSVCCGTSAAGARTFTATSSQGLALMHEILYIASALRLPIVMSVANRAISGPINIWNDHSDVMVERDVGWVQIFCENGQEAVDLTIWAFRLAEDPRVSLPIMVNFDGFIVSHMVEPLFMPDREMVKAFLPPFKPLQRLDIDNPISMGPVGIPDIFTEAKQVQQHLLTQAYQPIVETLGEFAKVFKRQYKPVETYRGDDADVLLLTMGAIGETAMTAVDQRRAKGDKVGLVRLRLWRPFPFEDLFRALGRIPVLGVIDRCISFGGPVGPVACEVKGALYGRKDHPLVVEFVAGLGGRDVTVTDFDKMFDALFEAKRSGKVPAPVLVGLRE
ncbi:MAG TPA: pyruvate ferredoxin oxidoreductase [Myxococcota bacterium]|nr:pyruvate ferredoxin oxidoreductase [Myxococcota bacterium]HRY95017.1 pyruvate ferredoxin oxidoreductase [Myxococcota bacterium]HSA21623.1 pyruvate ferredoxin oxidoreductase [Myxococcota bacterium]